MAKRKFVIMPVSILLCLSFTSCDFVEYVRYSEYAVADDGFEERLDEYLQKIETLYGAELDDEALRMEYITALLDAENELKECTDEEELDEVLDRHVAYILSLVSENYVRKINSYISVDDYREEEQAQLGELIEKYIELIRNADSNEEIETLFRDFKVEVYSVRTAEQYGESDLVSLKKYFADSFDKLLEFELYTVSDAERIDGIAKNFETALNAADDEDSLRKTFDEYCRQLASIKTKAQLEEAAVSAALAEWENSFNEFVGRYSAALRTQADAKLSEMRGLASSRLVNATGAKWIMDKAAELGSAAIAPLCDNAVLYLENVYVDGDYREEQIAEIKNIISTARQSLETVTDVGAALELTEQAENDISAVPTSDKLWTDEDNGFWQSLEALYSDGVLERPAQMYQASCYEELADIIDYYAFYQTSNDAFLRDTFRVKLLYKYRTAQWEINEAYWYCELIRSAVGITGHMESTSSGDYLVITLVPYAIATLSNVSEPLSVERYDSLTSYGNIGSESYVKREADFEAFPYLARFDKSLNGIWNTQQLWYAIENGYVPNVVEGSAADIVLERAEEILRDVIYEGMSDDEKIYAIFAWFSQNVAYDHGYAKYLYPEDREHFPDTLTALQRSFHVEGALLENYAVCEGYAKSFLLMLGMEGIEAYRIIVRRFTTNGIGNKGLAGYGSHAILAIKLSDGKYCYSDVEASWWNNLEYLPKFHQLLVLWNMSNSSTYGNTLMGAELDYADALPDFLTEGLTYNGTRVFIRSEAELRKILDDFSAEERSGISVSVFDYSELENGCLTEELIKEYDLDFVKWSIGGLTEYTLYKPLEQHKAEAAGTPAE